MKLIKTLFFLFLITFTTHSFAKSNEYYQQTLIHILTECNSSCQKQIFEQEANPRKKQNYFFLFWDIENINIPKKINASQSIL